MQKSLETIVKKQWKEIKTCRKKAPKKFIQIKSMNRNIWKIVINMKMFIATALVPTA